jgi:hypothetical protein
MTPPDSFAVLKPIFILLYVGFGVFCLALAAKSRTGPTPGPAFGAQGGTIIPTMLSVLAASIPLEVFVITGSHVLLAASVVGIVAFAMRHAAWKQPLTLLPAAAAVPLVLLLDWWKLQPNAVTLLPLIDFTVVLAAILTGFADRWRRSWLRPTIPTAIFLVSGLLLMIDLGGYRQNQTILSLLAHHWGAFIGPALDLKAGLVPFYDIPLQYGLGPTLAIAAACRREDCWGTTEAIVIVVNLMNALLILRMALATAMPRRLLWQGAVTIVVFAASFFWLGLPVEGNSLLATPSVGGIRFLPTVLVSYLLFLGRSTGAAAAAVPAVLWAPESAAMACAVFGLSETARIGLTGAAARTAAILAASYAGLWLLHRAVYGVWIDPLAFAEYVLHVPGPLPINPFSDALLLIAVFGLGGWLLVRRSPDPVTARRDRVIVFLLLATTSYWLGRSHPNNICNLMPFLVLVAVRVLDRPGQPSTLAKIAELGIATSVAALAMSPWHAIPYDPRIAVDIRALTGDFGSLEPDIEQIRQQIPNPGGLGIADFGESYTRHPSETVVWTPMDPGSLWAYVPSERRQLYIRRSVAKLRRSGWAIFDDEQRSLADDFLAGYVIAQQSTFDAASLPSGDAREHYTAICFDPLPELAGTTVGPACPREASP